MPKRADTLHLLKPGRIEIPGKSLTSALALKMEQAIEKGIIHSGELLPPLRHLAERHEVGLVTVRRAIDILINKGLVESLPRVGFRVCETGQLSVTIIKTGIILRHDPYETNSIRSILAIEELVQAKNWVLMFAVSKRRSDVENACIRRLSDAGMDALIIVPAVEGTRSAELETWILDGRPVIFVGHPGNWLLPDELADRISWIDVDNSSGIHQIMDYLWSLGHKRIWFASPEAGMHNQRLNTYSSFMALKKEDISDTITVNIERGHRGAKEFIQKLKASDDTPSAVISTCDGLAMDIIEAAEAEGIRVPQELSVAGFGNDVTEFPKSIPPLTTVDYSREEMAAHLIRLLEISIRDKHYKPERVKLTPNLIIRESCHRTSKQ